jgi:hypothetical protein
MPRKHSTRISSHASMRIVGYKHADMPDVWLYHYMLWADTHRRPPEHPITEHIRAGMYGWPNQLWHTCLMRQPDAGLPLMVLLPGGRWPNAPEA